MKVAGLITEYNPFHNGHLIHIEEAKRLTKADCLVVVMSGSFVQRGEPAVMDKYLRTKIALMAGADLVIELPAPFSCGSAEYFAGAGVAILDKLGVVDSLVFGSECGDIKALTAIAKVLAGEPQEFKVLIAEALKCGMPYPAAVSKAVSKYINTCASSTDVLGQFDAHIADNNNDFPNLNSYYEHNDYINHIDNILAEPNNMLGIEYIKALIKRGSNIKPVTYKRCGSYNDTSLSAKYPSASALRAMLFENSDINTLADILKSIVPPYAAEIMLENYNRTFPVSIDDFSNQLTYLLLSKTKEDLTVFSDVSGDIESRIKKAAKTAATCSGIIDVAKTKAFTRARISRCLMHILLDIKAADMDNYKLNNDFISYARILGFRKDSSALLSAIKKQSSIPLITRLAGYENILSSTDSKILATEIFASDIFQAAVSYKYREQLSSAECKDNDENKTPPANEFTRGLVII